MKLLNVARFGNRDLLSKRKNTRGLFLNFFLIMFLFLTWCTLMIGFGRAYDDILLGEASGNYLTNSYFLEDEVESNNSFDALGDFEETGELLEFSNLDLCSVLGKDNWGFVNNKYVSLIMDGETYQGVNDYSYYFEAEYDPRELRSTYTVPFRIRVCKSEIFFHQNDYVEYKYRYPDFYENAMLAGNSRLGPGELVISDYMLKRFGLDSGYDEMIGKKITFCVEGVPVVENMTLTGIVDSRLFMQKDPCNTQVFLGDFDGADEQYHLDGVVQEIPLNDFSFFYDVKSKANKIGIEISFIDEAKFAKYDAVASAKKIVDDIVGTFATLILVALGSNLINVLQRELEERYQFYGMLRAIGMKARDLWKIVYLQLFEMTLLSALLSFGLSQLVVWAINNAMDNSYGVRINVSLSENLGLIIGLTLLISLLALLVEAPIMIKVTKRKPFRLITQSPYN